MPSTWEKDPAVKELFSELLTIVYGGGEAAVTAAKGLLMLAEQDWIPVCERLPETGIEVLIYEDGERQKAVHWAGEWRVAGYPWPRTFDPSHWMHLPEPPATVAEQT